MTIKYDSRLKKYKLKISNIFSEYYERADVAADDVFTHCTGCYEWDELDCMVDTPIDLSEWDYSP